MAFSNSRFKVKHNHGCESPSHVVCVAVSGLSSDSDTAGQRSRPVIEFQSGRAVAIRRKGDSWYARSELAFETAGRFWEWLRERSRSREPITVFAYGWHFAAQLLGFWSELDAGRFSLTLPVRQFIDEEGHPRTIPEWRGMLAVDDKPFVVYAVGRKGTIKLVDVKNYFDVPLDKLAESFDVRKQGYLSSAYGDTEEKQLLHFETETILKCMTSTIDAWRSEERGNWQPTAARLAMSNYRHEFLKDHEIVIDNRWMDSAGNIFSDREPCEELGDVCLTNRKMQRSAYYGGESSYWYRGFIEEPLYKLDVVSLYPHCMWLYNYPAETIRRAKFGTDAASKLPEEPGNCTAHVTVFGCGDLPMRGEDGRVHYPQGLFSTYLCGQELEYASVNRRIREVHEWEEYRCTNLFQRYVEYWFAIRRQAQDIGDSAGNALAKILMNSLYGKWASRKANWTIDTELQAPLRWGYFATPDRLNGKLIKLRAAAGCVQRNTGFEERSDTFPAISAFVAAAGRVYMRRIRDLLPAHSCLLQQTDSLLVTGEGYDALCNSDFMAHDGHGSLRVADIYFWADIYGANHYLHSEGKTIAGLPEASDRVASNRWRYRSYAQTQDVIGAGPRCFVPVTERDYILTGSKTDRFFDETGWSWV